MTCIIQTFYNFELRFDSAVKLFARFHPYLFIVCAFIGIPVFILGMVFSLPAAFMLPAACLFGWC